VGPGPGLAAGKVLPDIAVDLHFRGDCALDPARTGATVTASGVEITVNAPDASHALVFRTSRVSETLDLAAADGDDRIVVRAGGVWTSRGEVSGRVVINAYRPFRGVIDLMFEHVVLGDANHTRCVVDGTIRAR